MANIERELVVHYLKDKVLEGKLIDIPTKFPENDKIGAINVGEIAIFQVKETNNYNIINLKDIRYISTLSSEPINAEFLQKENLCSHVVEYQVLGEEGTLFQRYMTSGITFFMNYCIDLLPEEKELTLSANSIVLNDIKDFNCTNLFWYHFNFLDHFFLISFKALLDFQISTLQMFSIHLQKWIELINSLALFPLEDLHHLLVLL